MYIYSLKNLKSFCGKRDAFDCAGIQAGVFRLPVDCSNQVSYTGVRHRLLHRKTSLYRLVAPVNDFTLGRRVRNTNKLKFNEFEIILWKKRRFRLRRVSSPGLLIACRLLFEKNFEIIYSRKAMPLDGIKRSSCGEGDVGHLRSSVG